MGTLLSAWRPRELRRQIQLTRIAKLSQTIGNLSRSCEFIDQHCDHLLALRASDPQTEVNIQELQRRKARFRVELDARRRDLRIASDRLAALD